MNGEQFPEQSSPQNGRGSTSSPEESGPAASGSASQWPGNRSESRWGAHNAHNTAPLPPSGSVPSSVSMSAGARPPFGPGSAGGPGAATGPGQGPGSGPGSAGGAGQTAGPRPFDPTAAPGQQTQVAGAARGQTSTKQRRWFMPAFVVSAVAALISSLIGGFLGAVVSNYASSNSVVNSLDVPVDSEPVAAAPGSAQDVAAKVLPSVVSIEGETTNGGVSGSGVILSSDGLILTNNHVIADTSRLQVRLNDGSYLAAKVVGADPTSDIAVIRASEANNLTPIVIGSSQHLAVGQDVVAVGSPLGLSGTVTEGIVSALDRPVRTGGATSGQSTVMNAIQTDAAINHGNSGGALVDTEGRLIGINSAIASLSEGSGDRGGSIGIGFAIPIDQAKAIADQIISDGKADSPVIGVQLATVPPADATIPGAYVTEIVKDGPAAEAGLPEDIVITHVDGNPIDSADGLIARIRAARVGQQVEIGWAQKDNPQEIGSTTITVGEGN